MEDKMSAGGLGRATNYGWEVSPIFWLSSKSPRARVMWRSIIIERFLGQKIKGQDTTKQEKHEAQVFRLFFINFSYNV